MATTSLSYTWQAGDILMRVAARYLLQSGYTTLPIFIDAVRAKNPTITDWQRVTAGVVVTIPILR